MHPQIYAKKLAIAQNKLAEQANAVAVRFGIEPPNLTPMAVVAREPELLRLFELEAVGNFLECLAQESESASVLTDAQFNQVYGEPMLLNDAADKSNLFLGTIDTPVQTPATKPKKA